MKLPRVRFGAAAGATLAVTLFVLFALVRAGMGSGMGFGSIGDPLVVIALFAGTLVVLAAPAALGLVAVRRFPAVFIVLVAALAGTGVLFLRPREDAVAQGVLLVGGLALAAWLGSATGRLAQVLWTWRRGDATARGTRWALVHAAGALGTCLLLSGWLLSSPASEGSGAGWRPLAGAPPAMLTDPAASGPYDVESFTYGSGVDARRPAYAEDVVLSTLSQDLRPLLPGFGGLEAQLHRVHWGFGLDAVPLNATVWMPRGEGPFPVVLFIPGIDPASERSELGYAYLGELLASRGYVVVATDMNFLRGPHIARTAGEMPVRAWLALKHLDLLEEWQELHPGGRTDRMDLERIVVGGHSRGGEAAILAATLNTLERYPNNASIAVPFGHAIRGVFALAPTDGLYALADQDSRLSDVSYLVLHGSHDGDVTSFMGLAQYQRIAISPGNPAFKASVYVVGANHSNFNARTSGRDVGGLTGLLLDPSALLGGEAQRQVTSVFVSAFADAVLRGDTRFHAVFQDPRSVGAWLPDTDYLTRFDDGRTRTVASFEEDVDPGTATLPGASIEGGTGTVWREESLSLRGLDDPSPYTQVARVGWDRAAGNGSAPSWEVRLPAPLPEELVHPSGQVRFSMARPTEEAELAEVTVELETSDGVRARFDVADLGPPPPVRAPRLWRVPGLDGLLARRTDEILQDYVIPLEAVLKLQPAFDPSRMTTVRFLFNRTPSGTILLDDIGFRAPAVVVDEPD